MTGTAVGTTKVFLGDTVAVRADFVNITGADHAAIGWGTTFGGVHLDIPLPKQFESPAILKWDVKPKKVGAEQATFRVTTSVSPSQTTERFLIVTDLQDFTLGCIEAHSTLSGKFNRAVRILNEAATAFREAYGEQETVLNSLRAADRMLEDIAFGVIFAAAGGYAGGALGTWLKGFKGTPLDGKPTQLLSDALIDTAKDTAKFSVRSLDRLRAGSSSPSVGGDSTAPNVADPIRSGRGKYSPAGEHPQAFLTKLSSRVAGEGEAAQALLTKLIKDAKDARRANSKADFDEDPVEVVNRGQMLDTISAGLVTDKKVYLAGLWKAWVKDHGWQNMRVYNAIKQAAAGVGEDIKDWLPKMPSVNEQRRPGQGPSRPL